MVGPWSWPACSTGAPSVRPPEGMLRNRSRRAVGAGGGGGGGLMPQPEPLAAAAAQSSSTSPRPYMALPQAGFLDGAEQGPSSSMSPTSILETKQFCCSALPPFLSERSLRKAHMEMAAPEPASVGLADVLREHGDAKAGGRKVVFGSQLRIQVPSGRAAELVSSPIEFGVKNRDAVLSPARRFLPEVVSSPTARVFAAGVAPGEAAMSEDYTCVISRGPNPRTRHIFDDCIVESCGDALVDKADSGPGGDAVPASGSLSSCHACRRQLAGHANDTFIHRGGRAFCSDECRYQEMIFDEAVDNLR
ncbi:FCS-Like Zinc finger 8-like isoform X1 [Triticum dicoccoides]|uniref:FCS-Like Zinc finger 8-like isoform X1 n=2 Tax=Triticum dicoccoides TaxID=85692 RepID=UPI000E78D8F3|nr:FCS-Like Zinc finger 8-like isoform X1 [Triticum dicoccoides]